MSATTETNMAWLVRQKAGTMKMFLTGRGGWDSDINLARQFPTAEIGRQTKPPRGKLVPYWLDANNNPVREVTATEWGTAKPTEAKA